MPLRAGHCLCAKSSLTSTSRRLAPSEAACWASCPEATRLPTRFTEAGRDRLATNVGRPEQHRDFSHTHWQDSSFSMRIFFRIKEHTDARQGRYQYWMNSQQVCVRHS